MADPYGIVPISLTFLHACVKGLVILGKAKHFKQDVSDVQLQTELMLHALFTWGEGAGLTQEPPTLFMRAGNAVLVPRILSRLQTLLSDLDHLREQYGLYLRPTSEYLETLDDEDLMLSHTYPRQEEYRGRIDTAIFRKRKEPWNKLKWAVLDEGRFDRVVQKAKGYIGELEKLLEQARQEKRDREMEHFLRGAIINANVQASLGVIEKEYGESSSKVEIAAAAKFKQTMLKFGWPDAIQAAPSVFMASSASTTAQSHDLLAQQVPNAPLRDMRLSMRHLMLSEAALAQPLRTLARYDERVVLLEWKSVPDVSNPDAAILRRVNQVAALLQELGPTFCSLQCRGFVQDRHENRYGYVFDLPDDIGSQETEDMQSTQLVPELRSLREILDHSQTPSLNARLGLAVKLLDGLLNLHTSGWLHKAFRSDNIILIQSTNGDQRIPSDDLWTSSVYITGYIYSRIDHASEMTEPLQSELEADLYRHPSVLSHSLQPYNKGFDLFSVGCILLEIGLWSSLGQILLHHSTLRSESAGLSLPRLKHELLFPAQQSDYGAMSSQSSPRSSVNRSSVMHSLEAATGKQYTGIVEEFLAAAKTIPNAPLNYHDFVLDLETRARDTVKAITEAI